jgi:hypothetical protein
MMKVPPQGRQGLDGQINKSTDQQINRSTNRQIASLPICQPKS